MSGSRRDTEFIPCDWDGFAVRGACCLTLFAVSSLLLGLGAILLGTLSARHLAKGQGSYIIIVGVLFVILVLVIIVVILVIILVEVF